MKGGFWDAEFASAGGTTARSAQDSNTIRQHFNGGSCCTPSCAARLWNKLLLRPPWPAERRTSGFENGTQFRWGRLSPLR